MSIKVTIISSFCLFAPAGGAYSQGRMGGLGALAIETQVIRGIQAEENVAIQVLEHGGNAIDVINFVNDLTSTHRALATANAQDPSKNVPIVGLGPSKRDSAKSLLSRGAAYTGPKINVNIQPIKKEDQ